MIVCVCRRVSDREIERLARSGCGSFDELQMESGVGTCCGSCTDCAQAVFHRAQRQNDRVPVSAPVTSPALALA